MQIQRNNVDPISRSQASVSKLHTWRSIHVAVSWPFEEKCICTYDLRCARFLPMTRSTKALAVHHSGIERALTPKQVWRWHPAREFPSSPLNCYGTARMGLHVARIWRICADGWPRTNLPRHPCRRARPPSSLSRCPSRNPLGADRRRRTRKLARRRDGGAP